MFGVGRAPARVRPNIWPVYGALKMKIPMDLMEELLVKFSIELVGSFDQKLNFAQNMRIYRPFLTSHMLQYFKSW